MSATTLPRLTSMKKEISTDPAVFGELTNCTPLLERPDQLRDFMHQEGYLYLKGVLDPAKLTAARLVMAERLVAIGQIDTNYPLRECIATRWVPATPKWVAVAISATAAGFPKTPPNCVKH